MSHVSLNQNQLAQTPVIGQVAYQPSVETQTCQIYASSVAAAGTFVAGAAVKLVAQAGPEIIVDLCANAADGPVFGVIAYNPRNNSYVPGDRVEVACELNEVFLLSSAAISRGSRVAVTNPATSASDPTVATDNTNGDYTLGVAISQASGAGQFVRVKVRPAQNIIPNSTATCTSVLAP